MIVFKDVISQDELFSDTYKFELLHGAVFKVKGKLVTEKTGDIDESAIGGNASAEGGGDDEGAESSSVSGVDIILANRLVQTGMKKKEYKIYIKDYMKAIEARMEKDNPEEIAAFKKGCSVFVKDVFGDYDNFDMYLGEKMDPDGMHCLLRWEGPDGGDELPYMYFFKHGLDAEKV